MATRYRPGTSHGPRARCCRSQGPSPVAQDAVPRPSAAFSGAAAPHRGSRARKGQVGEPSRRAVARGLAGVADAALRRGGAARAARWMRSRCATQKARSSRRAWRRTACTPRAARYLSGAPGPPWARYTRAIRAIRAKQRRRADCAELMLVIRGRPEGLIFCRLSPSDGQYGQRLLKWSNMLRSSPHRGSDPHRCRCHAGCQYPVWRRFPSAPLVPQAPMPGPGGRPHPAAESCCRILRRFPSAPRSSRAS